MSKQPAHVNGCMVCPRPEPPGPDATKAENERHVAALQRHIQASRTLWFEDQRGYLELCRSHWDMVHRFIHSEEGERSTPQARPAQSDDTEQRPTPNTTLEAWQK